MSKQKEESVSIPNEVNSQEDAQAIAELLYKDVDAKELHIVTNRQAFKDLVYAEKYAATHKMKVFTVKL